MAIAAALEKFDLLVIGGGSGGLAAAKRAAFLGAKVAIAEPAYLGGTCVARGCVPKKLMVYASGFSQLFEDAVAYGWSQPESHFNWSHLMAAIHRKIQQLDQLHADYLQQNHITLFRQKAAFVDAHTVEMGDQKITAETILIAVGGRAIKPGIPGSEHALISDQMFHLPEQPRRFAIVGGGYIGVEFAAILRGLGSEVMQIVRDELILDRFDAMIRTGVQTGMANHGVQFHLNTEVERIEKIPQGLHLSLSDGSQTEVDGLLIATGRSPNLEALNLENAGVEVDGKAIGVDDYSQTNQPHIYAVGDCTNRVQLTPVAIAEGRAFADTVFGDSRHQVNYEHIPSSVFGKPQAAYVGLTEATAKERFGAEGVIPYYTRFSPLFHSFTDRQEEVSMKLVVERQSDRILGVHMVGDPAAEIIQMAAIAVTAGLTKRAWSTTMPLHPTTAEEMITLHRTDMPKEPVQPCWMCN